MVVHVRLWSISSGSDTHQVQQDEFALDIWNFPHRFSTASLRRYMYYALPCSAPVGLVHVYHAYAGCVTCVTVGHSKTLIMQ